ncbi:hypothetical protein B0T24DRAFT_538706 [Lasiosphaeria ovina]|uniref:NmrA-like domain-containing protein n=1 Tax=Lasiosphaeria ovina TaxID=92902 RepID=A0AAE0MYB9_9PEZI|nr:hypothetical protein B0T24DRAFT_538706 [Lasiosphaeria ovina]
MVQQRNVLVTGATGNQGQGVVRRCLEAGHQVWALSRDPSSASAHALAQLGAKLVRGEFDDAASLQAAFTHNPSIDAVFHVQPQTGNLAKDTTRARNVISAARSSASVTLMVASTSLKVGQHETFPGWGPDYPTYVSWLARHSVEELVRGAGFAQWAMVRPAHFLQLLTKPGSQFFFPGVWEDDRTLRVAWKPDTKLGWIDGADVGVVVAAVLGEPGRYAGREIDLGVEALTIGEVADKLSGALGGAEVKVHYYSDEELAQGKAKQDYRVLAAMHWGNAVETASSAAAAEEFAGLTSVSEFLARNRDNLL